MCVEVFHETHAVEIPFAHELIRFKDAQKVEVRYCFLLKNLGSDPLRHLCALYPRSLFDVPLRKNRRIANLLENRVTDITSDLPGQLEGFLPLQGNELQLVQPDPNDPKLDRGPLQGIWLPDDIHWGVPNGFTADHISAMRKARLTGWHAVLNTPIAPQESRWFWWLFRVDGVGLDVPTTPFRCPIVLQQVASPVDVRRGFVEHFESAMRSAKARSLNDEAKWYSDILAKFGLQTERKVNIQYYELAIHPGHPSERMILSWQMERDLRMRSISPREAVHPKGHLIYEWKSGTILNPDHDWKDEGFILHFVLAFR